MRLSLSHRVASLLIVAAVGIVSYVTLRDVFAISAFMSGSIVISIGGLMLGTLHFADLVPLKTTLPLFQPGYADHVRGRLARAQGVTSTGSFLRGKRVANGFWSCAHA